jgi:lipopolysaccharide/colanic/teichoic acid biosynthesis glycosyltransferase
MGILHIIFSLLLIIVMLPLLGLISLIIFLLSGFPVIYCQKRNGKDGKQFVMYKFRTMITDAEKQKSRYIKYNEASGPAFKIRNDPRFTRIGKLLSHTGLDELPQLFNVLKGEMSLIGPRPLPVAEAAKLNSWQREREQVKPGIISPWILEGYHKQSFDEWMKSDISYLKTKSIRSDFSLFVKSVGYLGRLFVQTVRELV